MLRPTRITGHGGRLCGCSWEPAMKAGGVGAKKVRKVRHVLRNRYNGRNRCNTHPPKASKCTASAIIITTTNRRPMMSTCVPSHNAMRSLQSPGHCRESCCGCTGALPLKLLHSRMMKCLQKCHWLPGAAHPARCNCRELQKHRLPLCMSPSNTHDITVVNDVLQKLRCPAKPTGALLSSAASSSRGPLRVSLRCTAMWHMRCPLPRVSLFPPFSSPSARQCCHAIVSATPRATDRKGCCNPMQS